MSRRRTGGFLEEELSVTITSLIDVIFILLIFFMVTTQFKNSAIPLDLPKSERSVQDGGEAATVLSVNAERIELDGVECPFEELDAALSALNSERQDAALSLECERTVEFERIVQILTKIQNAGISRIGIVHEPLD
ncbi:MAG: biopolymer transporter ExbD [Treponemataceae bacterium]|nr:biopolymer transporter ExbD [Treponemataceae bacterium]